MLGRVTQRCNCCLNPRFLLSDLVFERVNTLRDRNSEPHQIDALLLIDTLSQLAHIVIKVEIADLAQRALLLTPKQLKRLALAGCPTPDRSAAFSVPLKQRAKRKKQRAAADNDSQKY